MAYLQLLRWPNLLLIGLIHLLAKTQLVDPVVSSSGYMSCLSGLHWVLLAFSTICIAASGNVINDLLDQDIDRINRPDRMLIGKVIPDQVAWNLYYALGALGLISGITLCWMLGSISASLIFVLAAGALYFYSYSYKRQLLVGNLVVALLAGLVPFMPVYLYMICEPQMWKLLPWNPLLMAFAVFSFLTTFIREVIKDMEDLKGDSLQRCRTLPVVIGLRWTKLVVVLCVGVLIGAVGRLQYAWWANDDRSLPVYFLITVQIPALLLVFRLFRAQTVNDFHRASSLTKLIMLAGVLSMLIFRTYVQ